MQRIKVNNKYTAAAAAQRQRNSIRVRQLLLLLKRHRRMTRTGRTVFLLVVKKSIIGSLCLVIFCSLLDRWINLLNNNNHDNKNVFQLYKSSTSEN